MLGASPGALVVSRLQRLIWPLVLWTWIFFLFKGLAGGLANKPSDWADFPILPLPPKEHFWFLWALFVIQLSLILCRPILKRSDHRPREWLLLWLASVVLCLAAPDLGVFSVWLGPAVVNAPFFLLGAAAAGLRHRRPPVWVGLLAFVACLGAIAFAVCLPGSNWMRLLIGGGATLLLCTTVMALERPVLSQPKLRWIGWLGTASLAIYVSHTIFSAAARIVLLKTGVTDVWVQLGVGTFVGLACPAALYIAARRMGIAGKLGF